MKKKPLETTWQGVEKWYDASVGEKGHYYHQKVIFPNLLKLLPLKQCRSLLDLGCGQGVFARHLPPDVSYLGVDISPGLIKAAKRLNKNEQAHFQVADLTKGTTLNQEGFDAAVSILALQNMEKPDKAIKNAAKYLNDRGYFAIVLNHPCFRIPRQTFWQVDEGKKIQYRRIDRYLSPLKIPIQMHPGKQEASDVETWSFHHPLSTYVNWLKEAGFAVTDMGEWCSDKTSVGGAAKMENRARQEFPLFLAILARKI